MNKNNNKCSVCSSTKVLARGYCSKHYSQWYKHGKTFDITTHDFNEIIDCDEYYELILTDNKMNEVGRAKIDKKDLIKVKRISRWCLNTAGYVNGKIDNVNVYMHRYIMEAKDNEIVDHVKTGKKSKSDNRRKNIRVCTDSENKCNIGLKKNNTSGYKGVGWHEGRQQWRARITFKGKVYSLGWFKTKSEAIEARVKASDLHGKFKRIK